MDALKNLSGNIPDWVKRLEELSGQIEQRQIELAKFAEANPPADTAAVPSAPSLKSVRNKGSTESLRPADEPAAFPCETNATTLTPPTPVSEPADSPAPPAAAAPRLEPTSSAAPTPDPVSSTPVPPLPESTVDLQPSTTITTSESTPKPEQSPEPTPSATQRQKKEVIAAAQARARASARKRHHSKRPDSVVSAEGAIPVYRSKTMVLVYYDSYVQSFFEELVKFVSASRNLMRKAKMAAKVAHIKRMAEMEAPDYGDDEEGEEPKRDMPLTPDSSGKQQQLIPAATTTGTTTLEPAQKREGEGDGDEEELPPLKYLSTRQMRTYGRIGPGGAAMMRPTFARAAARGAYGGSAGFSGAAGGFGPGSGAGGDSDSLVAQVADTFDSLDKGLEFVQAMCEQAAHQFLREGDCDDEIGKIKSRLAETNELATKELGRKRCEKPGAAGETEPVKSRSYRPQSMRRESGSPIGVKGRSSFQPPPLVAPAAPLEASSPKPSPPQPQPAASTAVCIPPKDDCDIKLEVDEGIEDMDFEAMMPKLVYKSTRMMRAMQ